MTFSPVSKAYFVFLPVAFLSGMLSLTVEIAGARALSPYFGSGPWTWSAQMAVALLGLAAGYRIGGSAWARRSPIRTVVLSLFGQAALCAAATTYLSDVARLSFILDEGRVGVFISTIAAFGPVLVLSGIVPMACIAACRSDGAEEGPASGNIWGVSTLGSFVGALLAGFWAVFELGTQGTFFLASAFALAAFAFLFPRKDFASFRIVSVGASLFVAFLFFQSGKEIMSGPVPIDGLGRIEILEKSDIRSGALRIARLDGPLSSAFSESWRPSTVMLIDGLPQSVIDESGRHLFSYAALLSAFPLMIFPDAETSCWVGVGGGAGLLAQRTAGLSVKAVDLDPDVRAAAVRWFGLPSDIPVEFDDGRRWTARQASNSCDIYHLDAFGGDATPAHLVSKEAFLDISRVLSPDGVLAINFIAFSEPSKADDLALLYRTLTSVFPHVRAIRVPSVGEQSDPLSNWIVLASSRELDFVSSPPDSVRRTFSGPAARHLGDDEIRRMRSAAFPASGEIALDGRNRIEKLGSASRTEMRTRSGRLSFIVESVL